MENFNIGVCGLVLDTFHFYLVKRGRSCVAVTDFLALLESHEKLIFAMNATDERILVVQ